MVVIPNGPEPVAMGLPQRTPAREKETEYVLGESHFSQRIV